MNTEDLLKAAGSMNVEEFVNSASSYISALGSIEEANREAEQERLKQQQEAAAEALKIQQDQAEEAIQLARDQAEEIARITKERDDEIMKGIDDLFLTFEKLSEGIQSVQRGIQDDMLSFANAEQVAARRQAEIASLGAELSTFGGADINRADDMETITQKSDYYRQLIMEETDARVKMIEEEKQIAQDAFNRQIEQYRDWANSVKTVISTVSGDIEKLRGELSISDLSAVEIKAQLAEQFSQATDFDSQIQLAEQYRDAIQKALDENIQAVEKARDERISALEQERDIALENLKSQNEAAKQLRGELEAIQNSIMQGMNSVAGDIENIRKNMKLPGATAREQLAQFGAIPTGMTANQANIDDLEKRRVLITAAMEEQIQLEEEKVQKEKDLQQSQVEHYKTLIDFSKELKSWIDDLAFSDLSTLKPVEMLKEAERQYQDILSKAQAGDADAKGKLTGITDEYLKQARDVYASSYDYTKIFEGVRSEISGLATTTENEAQRLQAELPLDDTVTGQNIDAIRQIQTNAITQLQAVDAALNGMKADITSQLSSPAATPLPDSQLNEMLAQEEARFNNLIENENINAEKQITAYKEGAVQELTTLNETLNAVYSQLEAAAEKQFDDTPFAQNIQAVQAAALFQLNQLGGFLVALDGGLKQSLTNNVNYLAAGLSVELQNQVAARLDELIEVSKDMLEAIGKNTSTDTSTSTDKLGVLGSVLSGYDSFDGLNLSGDLLDKRRQQMTSALESYKQSSVNTFSNQQYDNASKYVNAITDPVTISNMLNQGIQKGSAEFWKMLEPEKSFQALSTRPGQALLPPRQPGATSIFEFMPMGTQLGTQQQTGMGQFNLLGGLENMSMGSSALKETLQGILSATDAITVKLQELFDLERQNELELNESRFERLQELLLAHTEREALLLQPLQEIWEQYSIDLGNFALSIGTSIRDVASLIVTAIRESLATIQAELSSQPPTVVVIQSTGKNGEDDTDVNGISASFDTGTPYVERDMTARIHQKEMIIDSPSSEILRRYGIRVQSSDVGGSTDSESLRRLEALLQQLLVALEKNTQQSSQNSQKVKVAVEELENTVGRPIKRAIEESRARTRN